jgi:hypothetical protein
VLLASLDATVAGAMRLDYDRSMSARAAIILGMFLVIAALVHGGVYTSGHDFVLNRFTGVYTFVPAEDYEDSDDMRRVRGRFHTLTSRGAAARVDPLQCRR